MRLTSFSIAHAVFKRTWLKILRRPVSLTFSLVQPLMWMLFFGFLFQRYSLDGMPEGTQYIDFLVPGICAMTVLLGSSQSGIELIRDMQTQFLGRIISTPASKPMILTGKVLADASRLIIQAFLVLLLGWMLGAKLHFSIGACIYMTINFLLFSVAFCSLSCWIALKSRSQENMATFVHLVNMPLLFTSTALVPAKQMPAWLAEIARFNPLSLIVNNNRAVLLLGDKPSLVQLNILLLVIMMGGLFLLASNTLKSTQFD